MVVVLVIPLQSMISVKKYITFRLQKSARKCEKRENLQTNLEQGILRNLLTDENYMRKVLPFVRPDYFEGVYKILFKEAGEFVGKYNKLPTIESFKIELDQSDKLSSEQYSVVLDLLPTLFAKEENDPTWLLDHTEKWCQDRAIY